MILTKETLKKDFEEKLMTMFAEDISSSSTINQYIALGSLIKDYVSKNWIKTNKAYKNNKVKQVYYFSMEFLIGKLLTSYLINLDLHDLCKVALSELNINLEDLEQVELDAGLGNGGLGRLAACFLDSMASLSLPGHGCGIRYKYGLFEQKIIDGYQREVPDNWLKEGNVWEIRRENKAVKVPFYGNAYMKEINGELKAVHENYEEIIAVPYDIPIIGYKNNTVNTLRIWSAEAIDKDFDFPTFSSGDYLKAVEYKYSVESISQVLYPDDSNEKGRLLRLKQEYFFVSAGIQSIVRSFIKGNKPIREFNNYVALHVNDTHPALAVAELMRILIDDYNVSWEEAFYITRETIAYTNHTILAEALEKWDEAMFKKLLPRIYMIVEEINRRFCIDLFKAYADDWNKINDMSIIQDGKIRMANLAIVGSHSVNGVAELHTEILKNQELKNFNEFYPLKFNNKTNGITHRRWLLKANPKLSNLITENIGDSWIYHSKDLKKLEAFKDNKNFLSSLYEVKRENKLNFASFVKDKYNIVLNPDSIFDVQVKRLHAYKRQLLNALNILDLYNRLLENPDLDIVPRTFIFGAKASPCYYLAKEIIKFINSLAKKINNDKRIKDKIKIVFLENYGVSLAEKVIPCADVSEQISTASKEASGTGNMKLMMNGAITLATLDGANIEILNNVGHDNIVTFGLTSKEVIEYYKNKNYNSLDIIRENPRLQIILAQLKNGFLDVSIDEFINIYEHLVDLNDEYFVLKDFHGYSKSQDKIDKMYRDKFSWLNKSLINIANSGVFSSDNTISAYGEDIWHIKPFKV